MTVLPMRPAAVAPDTDYTCPTTVVIGAATDDTPVGPGGLVATIGDDATGTQFVVDLPAGLPRLGAVRQGGALGDAADLDRIAGTLRALAAVIEATADAR
jgi:hypothetical protein